MARRIGFLFVLLGLSPRADAQSDFGKITFVLKKPATDAPGTFTALSATELAKFFNRARCLCEPSELDLNVEVDLARGSVTSGKTVKFWAGNACETRKTQTERADHCREVASFTLEDIEAGQSFRLKPRYFMAPKAENAAGCGEQDEPRTLAAFVDDTEIGKLDAPVQTDTKLPPDLLQPKAQGVEDGILITWDTPTTDEADLDQFQVLCYFEDNGRPIRDTAPFSRVFEAVENVCPGATDPQIFPPAMTPDAGVPLDARPIDAAVDASPLDAAPATDATATDVDCRDPTVALTNERCLCSGAFGKGTEEIRFGVSGSRFDATSSAQIQVKLIAIDDHRNPHIIDLGAHTPEPVFDFWEVYGKNGGDAEGGFCFVATAAYGSYDHPFVQVLRDFRDGTLAELAVGRSFIDWYYRHSPAWADFLRAHPSARVTARVVLWPVVVLAGAWEYTTALGKWLTLLALVFATGLRRRHREARRPATFRRIALAAGVASGLCMTGARDAMAQVVFQADGSLATDTQNARPSDWVFEIKFGPYHADVDSEPGLGPRKPYQTVFGGDDSLAVQFELDRFFLYPGGQLGLAFMAGYTQDSGQAILRNKVTGEPDYTGRAEGDETAFHLLPTALSAVYRFTYLADKTVIPLVPYAKLGLSYYLWWITKGDGSIATMEANGDSDNKARGGTLGWQGTVGLSFRADALDPSAAKNQETEWGIEHTGFFAEMTKAKVNGLKERRLNVGDTTWFAGVNFEF